MRGNVKEFGGRATLVYKFYDRVGDRFVVVPCFFCRGLLVPFRLQSLGRFPVRHFCLYSGVRSQDFQRDAATEVGPYRERVVRDANPRFRTWYLRDEVHAVVGILRDGPVSGMVVPCNGRSPFRAPVVPAGCSVVGRVKFPIVGGPLCVRMVIMVRYHR